MKRSIYRNAVSLVFLLVFLAGCSKKEESGVTRIRWIVDPAPTRLQEIAGFEKANPDIKVELSQENVGNDIILTQIAGDSPPDIFAIYEPAVLQAFIKKGALLDLTPYMEKYKIPESDFWPSLKQLMCSGGKVYGLPSNCGTFVLFYNKEMFDEDKIPYPTDKWTWQDMVNTGKKLVKKSADGKTYEHFGLYCDDPLIFIWQNGGRWFNADGKKCIINSPEAVQGMQYFHDLLFKHNIIPNPVQANESLGTVGKGGWGGLLNLFAAKRVAMLIQGRWMSMVFRKDKTLKWDIVSLPKGKYRVNRLAGKIYVIPYNSKHKEEAFRFLNYQVSRENQLFITNTGDGISSRMSFARQPEFLHYDGYPEEPRRDLHLKEMEFARAREYSPYVSDLDVDRIWNEEYERLLNKLQTAEETMNKIAGRVNKIIETNLKAAKAADK